MSVFAFPKESRSVDSDLIWSASFASLFECVDNRRIWLTSSCELALFPDAVIPLRRAFVARPPPNNQALHSPEDDRL